MWLRTQTPDSWSLDTDLPIARRDIAALTITAVGVVVGFPLLSALALQHVTSAHSSVFLGLLPLCTAIFAVVRAGERPRPAFWWFSVAGAACVVGYAAMGSIEPSLQGNGFMLAAIVVCGLGYAEGARLSRTLGGWQVISWALVLALSVMLPLALLTLPASFGHASAAAVVLACRTTASVSAMGCSPVDEERCTAMLCAGQQTIRTARHPIFRVLIYVLIGAGWQWISADVAGCAKGSNPC